MNKKGEAHFGRNTFKVLMRDGRRIFFYELIYYILVYLLLKPVFNIGFELAMNAAGYSYLTVENVFRFLFQPVTLLILAGFILLAGIIQIYGISLIMTYFRFIKQGEKISFTRLAASSFGRAWIYLLPRNFLLPVWTLLFTLFSNIVLIIGIASRVRMPRYFVTNIAKIAYIKPLFIVAASAGILISFLGMFLLPYCILEHKHVKESMKSSRLLLKGRRLRSVFYLLIWNIGIAAAAAAVYMAVIFLAAFFVKLFVQKEMTAAVFLSMYNHINFYVGLFIGILSIVSNIQLVTCMYFSYKEEQNEDYGEMRRFPSAVIHKKLPKRFILVLVLVLFVLDIFYTYDLVRNGASAAEENLGYIKITSHRGDSHNAPENTIPALEAAIDNMADYAEIDVQETKDGVIVLMHDMSLYRTAGIREAVYNTTYARIKELDAGSWFGEEFRGTAVPTLEEVLSLCKGRIKLNIELKTYGPGNTLIQKVIDLIREYDFERQCVITSSFYKDLEKVKEQDEDLKTGYIISAAYGAFYEKEAADFFSIKSGFITDGLVRRVHQEGKEVHAWTVNGKKEIERLKQIEVDNIITDRPVLTREVIYQQDKNKTFLELLDLIK